MGSVYSQNSRGGRNLLIFQRIPAPAPKERLAL